METLTASPEAPEEPWHAKWRGEVILFCRNDPSHRPRRMCLCFLVREKLRFQMCFDCFFWPFVLCFLFPRARSSRPKIWRGSKQTGPVRACLASSKPGSKQWETVGVARQTEAV